MTANEAYEQAAAVAEKMLREAAKLYGGDIHVGYDPEALSLASRVAKAIRNLKH